MEGLKALSPIQQRKAAAILGSLLADAATAPLHWIYDQDKVKELADVTTAFYPTSKCPYYTIPTGSNSTYGAQVLATLRNVAENKGFNAAKLSDALFKEFGPGTDYEKARTQSGYPVKGPWTNHNLKIFIANRENGTRPDADPTSADPDGLCKAVIIVALLSGKGSLLESVEDCVKTTQSNVVAIDYAVGGAALLNQIILTGENGFEAAEKDATPAVQADTEKGRNSLKETHVEAAKEFGLACGFPGSYLGMIDGIRRATGFEEAVNAGIRAARDNCSRNTFIGACVGAKYGLDQIPEDWLKKYSFTAEVLPLVTTVVSL